MSNTKTLPLEDIMGISKSWLNEMKRLLNVVINSNSTSPHIESCKLQLRILETIESQLFPIKPIVEDAFGIGYSCVFNESVFDKAQQSYLSEPITIKMKEDGK